jgi:hypothetical protein
MNHVFRSKNVFTSTEKSSWRHLHQNIEYHVNHASRKIPGIPRWSLTKTKYLFSQLILKLFAQLAHQNCCARQAYSKNATKMTIGVREIVRTYVLLQHEPH